ncbi:hypothetical protein ZIOFF_023378 [Zingiber officinale]|uniref:non-specific serine/threonine protein kinase n=1 Tax=Zingiber officinale TaxID=94328 RepID=A0A8J5GZ14_ZINOF|nr:hypothetical protein ZIOFF_023378 [Zingiber officinale]
MPPALAISGIYKPLDHWQLKGPTPSFKIRNCSSVFTLKEMEDATCMFSEENLLGKGGFGRVYKGTLKNGEIVAIKKMDLPACKEADGEREFRVEVDILSRLEHPNLVTLIGYCADGRDRFLVYEYMPNGNLQDYLNGWEAKMDWPLRLKVALGAARALAYLHSSSAVGTPVLHRDFKSTNILLTQHFEAKISDFGLAKLMPNGEDIYATTKLLGTFGYFDPEYALVGIGSNILKLQSLDGTGKLTLQSDVYAYGVVLLELLTGRRAIELNQGPGDQNLLLQVRHLLNDRKKLRKVVDPDVAKGSCTMVSVSMFANLASRCVRLESSGRPSMAECVKELQLIICANMRV